ncbi:putative leucine-rich repeat receptor-like protein kinase [Cocos nucifera]|uniref:Putative leucine-rich repeat receptor-like protein kinase n=1 Tax=Cocos nucifera TaxID=13894 RepID=A0A8K0NBC1_COCNU|nr:putative leucine-rich repeat receptor-like protein kinase [Cocos nucifera]
MVLGVKDHLQINTICELEDCYGVTKEVLAKTTRGTAAVELYSYVGEVPKEGIIDNAMINDAPDEGVKALNEIKASLGWRVVYAWVGDDPCGDGDLPPWSGVTCTQQGDYRVVTELEVYAVSIVGPFPTAVTNLLDLTRLQCVSIREILALCKFTLHLLNLTSSNYRDLHNNKLTGPIPPQIGRLKHLKILNLRWNKLQDVLPPEIGELKKLTHLYLSFNNFKGEIPVELANLPELRYLYLHENRFSGKIPPELGSLKNLRHLDVGNNHLTGTLRDLIRNRDCFPSLRNLYLNNNQLSGGLPDQLANLTNLEILYLSYNKMTGPLTPKLVDIPRLTYLYLDHNAFTGRIPVGLYKHPFLKELYIEGNQFKPGAKPKGAHKVLEVTDTEFVF